MYPLADDRADSRKADNMLNLFFYGFIEILIGLELTEIAQVKALLRTVPSHDAVVKYEFNGNGPLGVACRGPLINAA